MAHILKQKKYFSYISIFIKYYLLLLNIRLHSWNCETRSCKNVFRGLKNNWRIPGNEGLKLCFEEQNSISLIKP